jgi:hypothetical protein
MIVIFGEIIPQVRKDHYQEALKESLTDPFLTFPTFGIEYLRTIRSSDRWSLCSFRARLDVPHG